MQHVPAVSALLRGHNAMYWSHDRYTVIRSCACAVHTVLAFACVRASIDLGASDQIAVRIEDVNSYVYIIIEAEQFNNAPINVMPHYLPPGRHRGQGGDLTN